MARNKKPAPKSQRELSNNQVDPYVNPTTGETIGNPNDPSDFRQFTPNSQKGIDFNRSEKMSFKGDSTKPFTIGIQDIDEAVLYYFDNIIKPTVIQNGERIPVPLIYGSPERFKAVQKDGFYRDKEGKIMSPLIMFKRDSLENNRSLTNKLDANFPHLYTSWQKTYNTKNDYSNFSVLNNRIPTKQFIANVVPDYVTLTYSFLIQTYYIEQLNKVIEAINYTSDSYWGDPERFQFKSRIDTFNTITELNQGQDRIVRSNFSLKIHGYIIPDVVQKDINSIKKYNDKSKVIFSIENFTSNQDFQNKTNNPSPLFLDVPPPLPLPPASISTPPDTGWTRNPGWLPIPTVTTEIVHALIAVFPDGYNKVAHRIGGASTVDYGDGTTASFASQASSIHFYDFDSLPASTELTMDNGLVYRQALMTITPTTTFNGFYIFRETQAYHHQYLDLVMHLPNITSIANNQAQCPYLERISFPISTPAVNMSAIFNQLVQLQQIDIDWTKPTNIGQMAYIKVYDLGDMDLVNCTGGGTTPAMSRTMDVNTIGDLTLYSTNNNAISLGGLKSIGTITIFNDTNISNFLIENHALEGEIRIIAPNTTNASLLTRNCNKYTKLYFDAPNIENITQLCYVAYSVYDVELTDASNVTTTTSAFLFAYSLQKLRLPGIAVTFSVTQTNIDAPNMVILFNDLATVGGQTLTISSTPAAANLTSTERLIATNKGWTLVG